MRRQPTNICPLLLIAGIGSFDNPAECVRDRCAWWHVPGNRPPGRCALASIADALTDMNLLGVDINGN